MSLKIYLYLKKIAENRILKLIILILILGCLFIYYADNYPQHSPYNTINNPDKIAFGGEVTAVNSDGFVLTNSYTKNPQTLKVKSTTPVSLEDIVQVQGILIAPGTIQSTKVVLSSKWEDEFVIYRSIFGLVILLIIFFWYWKFDLKKYIFIRRH